jgi:dTDP-4-dehydrorhamnose 3,5-epimerase
MPLIDGVRVKKLRLMPDERGRVMEMLRCDDEEFVGFGQVYMTTAYPGVVKAWHFHRKQTDFFCCVLGMMKLVLYDGREGSATQGMINEFFLGEHNASLVVIPPMIHHGFKCISSTEAMVINVPTLPYDRQEPDEYRLPAHGGDIPYDWSRKDG